MHKLHVLPIADGKFPKLIYFFFGVKQIESIGKIVCGSMNGLMFGHCNEGIDRERKWVSPRHWAR